MTISQGYYHLGIILAIFARLPTYPQPKIS
jgi:hypothetical protein